MAVEDKILFYGGMDYDTEDRLVVKGDYRYALNTYNLSIDNNNTGVIKNVKGNTLINYTFPAGTYICIGACDDIENNRLFYFIFNLQLNHLILRYDIKTNVIAKILEGSILNFSENYKILNPKITGGLLYWTDNYNQPRKINIDKAYNYTNGIVTSNKYTTINEQVLRVVKYPPTVKPTISFNTDTNYGYNNIRGKMFQFATRYIYDDYEKSVLSPTSLLSLRTTSDEYNNGDWVADTHLNNNIQVSFDTSVEIVTGIEIFVKEANIGDWYLLKRVDKFDSNNVRQVNDNITYTYSFYNDEAKQATDKFDLQRLFDYVPLLAGDQEIIDKTRIVYADCTEGFDKILCTENGSRTEVNLVNETVSFTYSSGWATPKYLDNVVDTETGYLADWYNIFVEHRTNGSYHFQVETDGAIPEKFFIHYDRKAGDSNEDVIHFLVDSLNSKSPVTMRAYYYSGSRFQLSIGIAPNHIMIGRTYINETVAYPTFKHGTWYNAGIVYYDEAGRNGGVNFVKRQYVPLINEEGHIEFSKYQSYQTKLFWLIRHLPPSWATRYQWVITENTSISNYVLFYVNHIAKKTDGRVEVNVNDAIERYAGYNGKSIIEEWIYEKGDRIRFLYNVVSGSPGGLYHINDVLDFEIINYDATTKHFTIENFDFEYYGIGTGYATETIVEVYRPKKQLQDYVYYEIGENYPILTSPLGIKYHGGQIQNQDPNNPLAIPATGIITGGDSYIKLRNSVEISGTLHTWLVEEENYSDFYNSKVWHRGRPNIEIPDMRQERFKQMLRYGGIKIQQTHVNNLSRFDAEHYINLQEKFGQIRRILDVGYTLKVLQDHKEASIYIGRTQTVDTGGETRTLQLQDGVLGSIEYYEQDRGTTFAESVIKNNRDIYYFDAYRGEVIRSSPNGQIAISEAKMISYFKSLANSLLYDNTLTGVNVVADFDIKNGLYILTSYAYFYNPITKTNGYKDDVTKTIAFSEKDNRWKTFLSFIPERYSTVGQELFSFKSAQLYRHNTNNIRNNFFGTQYNSYIKFICNLEPFKVKRFLNISIDSNKKWSSPNITDINIPATKNYPYGMNSRLNENKFIAKEGVFYTEYLNDMNDTTQSTQELALINGRNLRGHTLTQQIQNSDTTDVSLFGVKIAVNPSEKS